MHEVVGWDQIEDAARARACRRALLAIGKQLLGEPSPKVVNTLSAIDDPERLDRMIDVIATLKSWKALLAEK